jgi:hypothetical protein
MPTATTPTPKAATSMVSWEVNAASIASTAATPDDTTPIHGTICSDGSEQTRHSSMVRIRIWAHSRLRDTRLRFLT